MKSKLSFVVCIAGVLFLAACATAGSQTGGGGDLTGKVWVLTDLNGKQPLQDTGITAEFTTDGKISGTSGCNRYSGSYTVSGSNLTISPNLAATMMACPQPVMDQEAAYIKALGAAKSYAVAGDQLTLKDSSGAALVTFKAQSQDLAGTSWQVIAYNNGKQAVTSVINGTTLTADFGKDGSVAGSAGCNDYNGTYKVTGDKISFGPLASTKKYCGEPAGVMDQESQYLAALQSAATYAIEGTFMEMRTADGAIAVQFQHK